MQRDPQARGARLEVVRAPARSVGQAGAPAPQRPRQRPAVRFVRQACLLKPRHLRLRPTVPSLSATLLNEPAPSVLPPDSAMSLVGVCQEAAVSALWPMGSVGLAGAWPPAASLALEFSAARAVVLGSLPGGSETARPPGASNSTASPMTRGCTRSLRRRHARPCAVASSSISTKLWRGCPTPDCSSGQMDSWSPVAGSRTTTRRGDSPGAKRRRAGEARRSG